jgi:hypothetical protein
MSPLPSAKTLPGISSGLAALLLLLGAFPAFGGTITVVNTDDSGPGSLRAAIASAAPGDSINFSLTYPATISLLTTLTLGPNVTIQGPGASNLTISGQDSVVVFLLNAGGIATLSGLTIARGSSLLGGGIFNAGTLTLTDCNVSGNLQGTQLGGGIFNAGDLTLNNSTVSTNSAGLGPNHFGGGIYNFQGNVILNNSSVADNTAGDSGGGIYNSSGSLTANTSVVFGNSAGGSSFGGGIFSSSGPLILTNSTISGNFAGDSGGGIFIDTLSSVSLFNSTVADNTAGNSGGGLSARTTDPAGSALTNSTLSGNVSRFGGGIDNDGTLTVINSTVSGNVALHTSGPAGGGISSRLGPPAASLALRHSIVASNGGGNCDLVEAEGSFGFGVSFGYNLSDDATCQSLLLLDPTDRNNTPAGLDPGGLKYHGGATSTIALLSTSVAVNAIPLSACNNPNRDATDQRGVPRPQGPACDIGAYEFFQSVFQNEAVATFVVIDGVQAMPLPPDTQQSLIAPLQAAVKSLNRGHILPAVNQLEAFINEVNEDMALGVLTQQQASELTTQAQGVIQSLGGLG